MTMPGNGRALTDEGDSGGPVVSVIVPTYNRATLLPDAIESVLAQSLTSFEIIVVDDGSTDGTAHVVGRYGARVRYVRTDNGGVAHARNVGMRLARGRYLTFLDSDDRLYPYALELQVSLLERFPSVGLVCAEMSGFDDHGFFERYHLRTYHRSAFRNPSESYREIYEEGVTLGEAIDVPRALADLAPDAAARGVYLGRIFDTYLRRLVLCQNTMMVRRAVVENVGERDVRVRHWQEVDYLLRITRRYRVAFVDVPTYQLRYHPGQISVGGKATWLRKQRILLRVVKRHAELDAAYYRRHRHRIEPHLAHLHRAVAVPMLLQPVPAPVHRRYARRARVHLARAAAYGMPARGLTLATRLPPPACRLLVSATESVRQAGRWVVARARLGRPMAAAAAWYASPRRVPSEG